MIDQNQTVEIYTDRQHSRRGGGEEFRAGAFVKVADGVFVTLSNIGDSFQEAEDRLVESVRAMGFEGEIKTGAWIDVYEAREEWYERQDARKDLLAKIKDSLEVVDTMFAPGMARNVVDGAFVTHGGLKGVIEEIDGLRYD